jgi:hypothetical protein
MPESPRPPVIVILLVHDPLTVWKSLILLSNLWKKKSMFPIAQSHSYILSQEHNSNRGCPILISRIILIIFNAYFHGNHKMA